MNDKVKWFYMVACNERYEIVYSNGMGSIQFHKFTDARKFADELIKEGYSEEL